MRGDGPSIARQCAPFPLFSPHAWGWSGDIGSAYRSVRVFPTCVGMVRLHAQFALIGKRFPHMRGDGPACEPIDCRLRQFSPHAWGWSELFAVITAGTPVFPTCVGMVRRKRCFVYQTSSFPHMRGDGPRLPISVYSALGFSPHAWGWSAIPLLGLSNMRVFPTCVGMVRRKDNINLQRKGFPHMRGDGPRCLSVIVLQHLFSPHAWGWSVCRTV